MFFQDVLLGIHLEYSFPDLDLAHSLFEELELDQQLAGHALPGGASPSLGVDPPELAVGIAVEGREVTG